MAEQEAGTTGFLVRAGERSEPSDSPTTPVVEFRRIVQRNSTTGAVPQRRSDLQQDERVDGEEDREEDGPPIKVALH